MQYIKNLIINNKAIFSLTANLYGFIRGNIKVNCNNQTITLQKNNQKFILPYKCRIYSFDIMRDWSKYTSHIKPDYIEKNLEVYDFSKPNQHYLKNGESYYCSYLPEDMESVNVYIKYLNPQKGDVIFDLGANCGLSAYYFSKKANDDCKIFSVEPDNLNYDILCKNIEQWNLKNIIPLNCGVWKENKELQFSQDSALGSCVDKCRAIKTDVIKIQAYTLCELAKQHNLEKINLIKMDIEGSEYDIFENIDDFINQYKPKFVMEIHKQMNSVANIDYFTHKFEKLGYEYQIIEENAEKAFPMIFAQPK